MAGAAVGTVPVGGPAVTVTAGLDAGDSVPVPAAVIAATVKVYEPAASPVTVALSGVAGKVTVFAVGPIALTENPVIPAVPAGAAKVTVACPAPPIAVGA